MRSPRTLLNAWQLQAKKQLGQNFLTDERIPAAIIAGAGIERESRVLEIGPGLGALTIPAARKAGAVWAVETDRRLLELLHTELQAAGIENVTLVASRIQDVDIAELARTAGGRLVVLGNLPYNISSQVMVQLVENRRVIDRAALMFQRELAQRLTAAPGTKAYGRLTVVVQYCADISRIIGVGADRFFPRPKVDSEVLLVRFRERIDPAPADERWFFRTVKAAFGMRRKTLKNALTGGGLGIGGDAVAEVLTAAGIDPKRRAETLSVAEFVRLSDGLKARLDQR